MQYKGICELVTLWNVSINPDGLYQYLVWPPPHTFINGHFKHQLHTQIEMFTLMSAEKKIIHSVKSNGFVQFRLNNYTVVLDLDSNVQSVLISNPMYSYSVVLSHTFSYACIDIFIIDILTASKMLTFYK